MSSPFLGPSWKSVGGYQRTPIGNYARFPYLVSEIAVIDNISSGWTGGGGGGGGGSNASSSMPPGSGAAGGSGVIIIRIPSFTYNITQD